MAIRPENHITGDKAIRRISDRLIPEEWTINIPDSDYGLDMLIEVIVDNQTTGKFFFIQSKGTLETSCNGKISYSMDVNRIKDYSEIKLPVLFVFYSKTEDKFWGRWMNYLFDTLTEEQKKQKSVTLTFYSYNEIDVDYLQSIGNEIDLPITRRVSLYCDNIPQSFKQFHTQAINVAKQFIGNDITDDLRLTCKTLAISYEGCQQNGLVIIHFDKTEVRIPININSVDFLFYPSLKKEECAECFLDLIYVIAIYSSQISSQSIDYALLNPRQNTFNLIPISIWEKFFFHLSVDKIEKTAELFKLAVQYQDNNIAQTIIAIVFLHSNNNSNIHNLYQELLSLYLSFSQENEIKGKLLYNLANTIRTINCYEAISFYMEAIKLEPRYREQYYWWQEVAGILYITRHYQKAERFYKKARRLSSEYCRNDIAILISDCLICQGKIEEAIEEERNFINNMDSLSGITNLKTIVTEIMQDQKIQTFDATDWFNKGIGATNNNNHLEAMHCFLFAWRLYDSDIEALVNAFIEAFNCMDYAKMAVIAWAIREQAPDEGYRILLSNVLSHSEINENTEKMIGILEKLFIPNTTSLP